MFPAFELLFVAFSALVGRASASGSRGGEVLWLKFQESAIVKLDTPGYPLWVMDKANAPILYKDAEDFYVATDSPSAILLNLTMSHDKKQLLVNNQPILPFTNYEVPPMVDTYQIPASFGRNQVKGIVDVGFTRDWYWRELTTAYRYLQLDYDRLVWADPYTGPYSNHVPRLTLRIMGLGAHSRNDELDPQAQPVLHVTLADSNHGSSDDPKRSYGITNIEFKSIDESYAYAPALEPENEECQGKSWLCRDKGLYQNERAPPYRFIWRNRFDQYGRIGSLRHAVHRKLDMIKQILQDAGPSMLLAFAVLMGSVMTVLAIVRAARKWQQGKQRAARGFAEDDRLIGEYEDKYMDEAVEEEGQAPPLLPQRPGHENPGDALVDIEDVETR